MTATLRKSIILAAPPEEVWEYLTQPDKLAIWFHAPKEPLTEGATLELYGAESGDVVCWGKVLAARAPEYLEYTFTIKPLGGAETIVKWTLTKVGHGTMLSLVHEGLPIDSAGFDLTKALDKGWDDHLGRMRRDING